MLRTYFEECGISFHCYADDTQMYLPLKLKDIGSLAPLLQCLEEIKAWMALNFLNFNENKTEVMLFTPGSTRQSLDLDLSCEALCKKNSCFHGL